MLRFLSFFVIISFFSCHSTKPAAVVSTTQKHKPQQVAIMMVFDYQTESKEAINGMIDVLDKQFTSAGSKILYFSMGEHSLKDSEGCFENMLKLCDERSFIPDELIACTFYKSEGGHRFFSRVLTAEIDPFGNPLNTSYSKFMDVWYSKDKDEHRKNGAELGEKIIKYLDKKIDFSTK